MHINVTHGPIEAVRRFNREFPIGTIVRLAGQEHRTWSHAGLGPRKVPVVFLEAIEEPVPLSHLSIDGYHKGPLRRGS